MQDPYRGPQILGTTVQNFIAYATWRQGLRHPYITQIPWVIYAEDNSHLLHPQSFYIIRLPELLTDLCNSHNSDLYSDLDTGPDHQWMVINVYKKEQNLNFFPQCKAEEGTTKGKAENM